MGYSTEAPVVAVPSAARTATHTTEEFTLPGGLSGTGRGKVRGFLVAIDCTAIAATPNVTFDIQTSTGPADAFASVLASTSLALAANTTTFLVVHPSLTARANSVSAGPLETKWRIVCTHADADSATYSVTVFPLS